MKVADIAMVRLYLTEVRQDLSKVETWLEKKEGVKDDTVLTGLADMDGKSIGHRYSFYQQSYR